MGNLIKGGVIVIVGALMVGGIVRLFRKNRYDKDGYNGYGYDRNGRDRDGYDREGFDEEGFDRHGYNRSGWDREGYSHYGFDRKGFNRKGFDHNGYDRFGYSEEGIDRGGASRQDAENTLLEIETLKDKAWDEMKSSNFREALTNIRTGIDHCVMLMLKHKTGRDFDDYDSNMQSRIEKCGAYKVLSEEEVDKLQAARKHSNAIHELYLNKEFNQVYFSIKTLEELIARTRKYLDVNDLICTGIQHI